MELLKLSKFKLQLQSLATEFRDLTAREHSATEQCQILIQKQKQMEEEFGRKLQELQSELAFSNELCQKLERKVSYLQNDNDLLENRRKELQGTIQNLLQSRECFVNAYEESTSLMKRSIEARDRKLSILNEKLNSHLSLFDSIEKEAFSIKQVMDNVQFLVREKEEVVDGLRSKMDKVSAFEKLFDEKIQDLENKLKINEDYLQKKKEIISELEGQLDAAKIRNNCRIQIEELQKNLSARDAVIQNLISEREALRHEVENLAKILYKVKRTVTNMDEKDKRLYNRALNCQEEPDVVETNKKNRIEVVSGEASLNKAFGADLEENQAAAARQEQGSAGSPLLEEVNYPISCMSEESQNFHQVHSANYEFQSAVNDQNISINNEKVNCYTMVNHLDSECSTTQAETSEVQV